MADPEQADPEQADPEQADPEQADPEQADPRPRDLAPPAPAGARRAAAVPAWREFAKRRDGMLHAMDGGLWLHRHVWRGTPMAHLVSTDRAALLAWGRAAGIDARRLQFKPLKDPRTGVRRNAWHWDLVGPRLPPPAGGG